MNTQVLLLMVVPMVVIMIFFSWKKKRNQNNMNDQTRNKDEVKETIKKYLKANGEHGKEVISSYVAKRPGKEYKKRDVYLILFKTRDSKKMQEDPDRALEVEIVQTRISKKEYDRKIVSHGLKDFETENKWIQETRKSELRRMEKDKAAAAKKVAKKKEKQKIKSQKSS